MNLALNDTEALMYAYVTEAIGVKESVLNQNEKLFASKPSDAHPDNVTNYVVVSMMANSIKNQATPTQIRKVADFYEKLYAEKLINIS